MSESKMTKWSNRITVFCECRISTSSHFSGCMAYGAIWCFVQDKTKPGMEPEPITVSQIPWRFSYDSDDWDRDIRITFINQSPSVAAIDVSYYSDKDNFLFAAYHDTPVSGGPRQGEEKYRVSLVRHSTELKIIVSLYKSNILCSSLLLGEGRAFSNITNGTMNNEFKYYDDCARRNQCLLVVDLKNKCDDVNITPLEAVRQIGDQLSVLCKVPNPIEDCRMTVGGIPHRLITDNLQGDVVYAGQGLEAGECGALIKNISEEWNGEITCGLSTRSDDIEQVGTMRLVVARAPGEPTLLSSQPTFKDGDTFMAQCVVPSGRPAAKITWFLGQEELLHGKHQPVVTSDPELDLQTISQYISWTLTHEDDTKMLVCRAEHEALEKPMEARRQLILQNAETTSTTVVIISSTLGISLILFVIIVIRKLWIQRNPSGTPRLPINEPSAPFYLNLLFRRECAQEIAEIEGHDYEEIREHQNDDIENHYEEIDPQEFVPERRSSTRSSGVSPIAEGRLSTVTIYSCPLEVEQLSSTRDSSPLANQDPSEYHATTHELSKP